MDNAMDYVGLVSIFEKKECVIDGKNQIYYEKLEPCCGFSYNFNNSGEKFVVLTGKLAGETIDNKSTTYRIADFQTLNELYEKNNNSYNYDKFMSEYRENIGEYYAYDSNKWLLSHVTDQELLQKIRGTNKDYDDTILNNNTDISQMYSSIKKTIISQDEQIMQILTALFKNQKVVNSDLDMDLIAKLKENILIYGSTGTGKTEILKRISKLYSIPIVIEDATSLSETGYQGRKITDMLEDLCFAADNDIELAQKGILVIDEFDKLAEKSGDSQSHVSRLGVQRSLLKLLDGSLFYFSDKKFDTSKLTIVALGAFTDINNENNRTNIIDFGNNDLGQKTNYDDYSKISSNDFIEYGIMRELIGRFSKTIAMNPLSKEDIIKILKESNFSPLNTYKKLFDMLDVQFDFSEEFIEYIAELAIAKQSGARSLKTVFDDCISSALFRIFAGEYSSISLVKPDAENNKPYVLTKTK